MCLCRNANLNPLPFKVDLHGLHVHEALMKLSHFIMWLRSAPDQGTRHPDSSYAGRPVCVQIGHVHAHMLLRPAAWALLHPAGTSCLTPCKYLPHLPDLYAVPKLRLVFSCQTADPWVP